jgi:threonine synthase
METTDAFEGYECTATGERYGPEATGRSADGAPLTPVYDMEAAAATVDRTVVDAVESVWDLAAVLPFPAGVAVEASEGGTPLVATPSVAEELGVGAVYVKDESRNPTGTVHDRGMTLAVTAASQHGAELLAHASPGNSAQSAAAYAGRAGIRSYAFVPSRSAFSNKAMVNVHGGDMRVAGGRYPDALAAVDDLESDYHSLQEFDTPVRHEGYKTLAYEILADLDWTVPDAVVVPAGTGEVVVGLTRGFRECRELGLCDGGTLPTVYAAQPSGCAPIVTALEAGGPVEAWETPDTIVGELEIPDPAGGDLAVRAIAGTDGDGVAVEDDDALESAVTLAQSTILEVGVAGGVAAGGAWALADAGVFDDDATVVVCNTESGTKTADVLRSHLMGKGV